MPDDYSSSAKQATFSAAHDLIEYLKADTRHDPVDIGKGVMVAVEEGWRTEVAFIGRGVSVALEPQTHEFRIMSPATIEHGAI